MSDPAGGAQQSHGDRVEGAEEFAANRATWRSGLAADDALRQQAVDLQVAAERYRFTYQWSWAGVPLIRLPDDVMVLQELFWEYRPQRVVETGVARGGGLLLNAALMRMTGLEPAVLGVDIAVFPHTTEALADHPLATGVEVLEADSCSTGAEDRVRAFLGDAERAVLILDSNHTHEHVLGELRRLAPLLPVGGLVLVADTLVEEFPPQHFDHRPWGRGDNPLTAVRAFLAEDERFEAAGEWGRRALVSEFRDGIVRRTS